MVNLSSAALAAGVAAFLGGLAWAASSDLRRFIIPNRACALAAVGYVLAGPAMPLGAWLAGWAVALAVLLMGLLIFARGWAGGGDVKLAAAVALWAGPGLFSSFMFITSVSAFLLALVMLSPLKRLMVRPDGAAPTGLKQPMPFGLPLAAGGACVAALRLWPLIQARAA
jgi:prepilin peptidase CpaA